MITPIEIESKVFKSGIGYDKKEVDHFLAEVLKDYEKYYKENVELNDKINVLSEGLQYYKTIEKTLQKALILAEKVAEETKENAKEKAKVIEQEAKMRAGEITADAKAELDKIHAQTLALMRQYDIYKAQYKKMAMAQIDILESESFDLKTANLEQFSENVKQDKVTKTVIAKEELKKQDTDEKTVSPKVQQQNNVINEIKEIRENEYEKQKSLDKKTYYNKSYVKNDEVNKKEQVAADTNTEEEYGDDVPRLTEEEIRALVYEDEAKYFR